ncbi:MAG: PadR family transcriptional regulator [Kouleothrix sp.]|jgi:DNA-binding PadR family transcriptional regulator|nr:PadR family transcriptional regulator [Kouleothrix sp.]
MPMRKQPLAIEHALLGFLRQQPSHAYEIHQHLLQAEALGLVWHVKQSQAYALLGRLEQAGYIAGVPEPPSGGPPRRLLALTAAGRAAFAEWVAAPVQHGRDFRIEFLAKLFFARQESPELAAALLERQRDACRAWLCSLEAQAEPLRNARPYEWLVLDFRIGQIRAILAWLHTSELVLNTD